MKSSFGQEWASDQVRLLRFILLIPIIAVVLLTTHSSRPVSAGTPDQSYSIERYYVEAATVTAVTSTDATNWTDAASISFEPPSTKNYLILASAWTNNSDNLYYTEVQLNVAGTAYSNTMHRPVDTNNNSRGFGTHIIANLASGASRTVKIEFRTENTAGTASIKWATIMIIEMPATYYNAEQNTENTTTSTSMVDRTTLVFTPVAGDYLVLATANSKNTGTGNKVDVQLTLGTTASPVTDALAVNGDTIYGSWMHYEKEALTNVEHTYKISYAVDAGGSSVGYIRDARITVIPLDDLTWDLGGGNFTHYYAEQEAPLETNLTTYTTRTNLQVTPSTTNDYLILASGLGKQEAQNYMFASQLTVGGTDKGEYIYISTAKKIFRPFAHVRKASLTKSITNNINIDWKSNDTGTNRGALISEANAVAINMNTAESYTTSTHTTVSNSFTGGGTLVYIWSHGLGASSSYQIAYYDGGGTKRGTDSGTSSAYGNFNSSYLLNSVPAAASGTWHAVVFTGAATAPNDYASAAGTTGYVVDDAFTVAASAIPEFPSVFAALVVAVITACIYYFMRKRRLTYAQA